MIRQIRLITFYEWYFQTDFDDGHCPTWSNQLAGLYNVYRAVHGLFPGTFQVNQIAIMYKIRRKQQVHDILLAWF